MRVSCILPVHDGARFLGEALESVLGQEYADLEVLVVDDGSTDDTPSVLEAFGDAIRVFRQDQKGPAAARNRGLDEASGDLIAFQDADDLWMPGKLARQVQRFEARPELELSVGMVQNFWMDELKEEEARFAHHPFSRPLPGYLLACVLARKSLFARVGGFDETRSRASDNDWFLRVRDAGAVEEMIGELLVRRRLHRSNLTRDDLASRDALLENMKASLDRRRTGKGG